MFKIRQPPKVAPKIKSKLLCMVMQLLSPTNTIAGSKVHIYSLLQNDLNLGRTSPIFSYIKHGQSDDSVRAPKVSEYCLQVQSDFSKYVSLTNYAHFLSWKNCLMVPVAFYEGRVPLRMTESLEGQYQFNSAVSVQFNAVCGLS